MKPVIIVVNSLVARGSVGGRATVFVLERMGFPVWTVPTLILPWHLGHGRASRIVPDAADFARLLADLAGSPRLAEVGAVITGYFAVVDQIAPVADLVAAVKAANPDALYLCDPVIGDSEGLYRPEPLATAVRDRLLPLADMATPNRHELRWLVGGAADDNHGLIKAARGLGPAEVVVTSAFADGGQIGNLVVDRDTAVLAAHPSLADVPHGPGDLLAALYLAERLAPATPAVALQRAVGSTLAFLRLAVDTGADEIPLAAGQGFFANAPAGVTVTVVDGPELLSGEWVAGADGCRAGWAVVYRRRDGGAPPIFSVAAHFSDILDNPLHPSVIAVDMPIGLPERTGPGGRGPERTVRPLLGARQSAVFSVPSRSAVMAADYPEACRRALATSEPPRKVSKQCYHLFPKIREIDAVMTPALEGQVYESHPELAFWRLNGERAMALPKKVKNRPDPAGLAERQVLLTAHGFDAGFLIQAVPPGVGRDDLIDAAVLALIAERIAAGAARAFPAAPERDARGLRTAIWA